MLNTYLTGNDSVKRVINSPCLDFSSGKVLSYDGQKVFNSNSRYGRGNRRGGFNNRGRGNRDRKGNQSGNDQKNGGNQNTKSKKNFEVSLRIYHILDLNSDFLEEKWQK